MAITMLNLKITRRKLSPTQEKNAVAYEGNNFILFYNYSSPNYPNVPPV